VTPEEREALNKIVGENNQIQFLHSQAEKGAYESSPVLTFRSKGAAKEGLNRETEEVSSSSSLSESEYSSRSPSPKLSATRP